MRLLSILAALSLYGCSVFGGSQLSCKVRDPDLAQGIYHGGCKDGWANGYGEVVVSRNGTAISSYRGDFVDGKKRGKGTKIMPNGDRYTGDFRDDYREGQASMYGAPIRPGQAIATRANITMICGMVGGFTSGPAVIVMRELGKVICAWALA